MRKNILFNTTKQWNPGDQFIMMGVLRLLEDVDYNPIIFNRHPNIWGKGADNSFKPDIVNYEDEAGPRLRHDANGTIDYYIAAGTPEWDTKGVYPVFDQLIQNKIRNAWIGVGCGLPLSPKIKEVMKLSDVVIARDSCAAGNTKAFGSTRLPCPAFFVGEKSRLRKNTDQPVVGLVYMSDRTGANRVTPQCRTNMITQYTRALKEFPNAIIICHYIDEALDARKVFPGAKVFYSYNSDDFESFFDLCDITIGPRLHGAVFGASLGVPGYMIVDINAAGDSKGRRKGGIAPFGMQFFNEHSANDIVKALKDLDIETESRRLRKLRHMTHMKYMKMMVPKMRQVFDEAYPSCKSFLGNMPYYATTGANSIPALSELTFYQHYRLLGQQKKPKNILEIGSRYGYSLASLLKGAGCDNVDEIVSIDLENYGNQFNKSSQEIAEANIKSVGYRGKSTFHKGNSANYKQFILPQQRFDLIHIDGDHSYAGAKRDMENAWDNLERGGTMAVDDMDNSSVYHAVEDFTESKGIDHFGFKGSKHGLALIKKP